MKIDQQKEDLETALRRIAELRDELEHSRAALEIFRAERSMYLNKLTGLNRTRLIEANPEHAELYRRLGNKTYVLSNGYVGNFLLLWKRGKYGYTTDITEAHYFDELDARREYAHSGFKDLPWLLSDLVGSVWLCTDPSFLPLEIQGRQRALHETWRDEATKNTTNGDPTE